MVRQILHRRRGQRGCRGLQVQRNDISGLLMSLVTSYFPQSLLFLIILHILNNLKYFFNKFLSKYF